MVQIKKNSNTKVARTIAGHVVPYAKKAEIVFKNRKKIKMKTYGTNSTFVFCRPAKPTLKDQKSYFLPTLGINHNFEKS